MTIKAPAKVNFSLRVLRKREDGYHEIETLMAPISLADEIDLEVAEGRGRELDCDDPTIPLGPENLICKAAEVFATHTGLSFHWKAFLRKKIPHGAGLGGGSSNAAAVLKALDQWFQTRLGTQTLENLASQIGSDIPFFIRAIPAICRGRGEKIQPLDVFEQTALLLLKPPFPVSTSWAYQAWSANHQKSTSHRYGAWELNNDLQGPVFEKYLLLPCIQQWLLQQEEVTAAMMSGSGSTIYAILKSPGENLTRRAQSRFGPELWTAQTEVLLPHKT